MKVVLIYRDELLPLSETFIRQQAMHLNNWQAVLIGNRVSPRGLSLEGIRYHLLDQSQSSIWGRWAWRFYRKFSRPIPAKIKNILNPSDGVRPELVHVHFGTDAVVAWPWLKGLGLPVVVTLHGYDVQTHPEWWTSGQGGDWMKKYPERLRKMASDPRVSFIAVSEAIKNRAISAYGLPETSITKLFIGVDTEVFRPNNLPVANRPPHVLFIGRLVEKKGLDILIQAMTIVHRKFPEARVKVVGDGPLREQHEAKVKELQLPVDFLGPLPSDEVRRLIGECAIFCLPSVTSSSGDAEGFGIVILEAQASGVPVVTSAVGGRDEGIEHGRSGFGFPEGDHEALAGYLNTLIGDPQLCEAMGKQARELAVNRFDIRTCCHKLEEFYTSRVTKAAN